jgi:hypothetical protein
MDGWRGLRERRFGIAIHAIRVKCEHASVFGNNVKNIPRAIPGISAA